MTALWATLRPMRTEIRAVVVVAVLIALAAAGVTLRLLAFGIPDACFDPDAFDAACVSRQVDLMAYSDFASTWGGIVAIAALVLPSGAGVILGIAAVGKELDQRTAVLAWSLSPSRRRWLIRRLIPLGLAVILLGLGSSFVAQAMVELRWGGPMPVSFDLIALAGLAPAAEGLGAFGIGLVVGAMLGRLIPGLLASAAFAIFAIMMVTQGTDRLLAGESIVIEQGLDVSIFERGKYIDSFLRTADGRPLSWDEVYPDYADPQTGELLPSVRQFTRIAPIEIYPQVAARFLLFYLVIAATTMTLGIAVTDRKTP